MAARGLGWSMRVAIKAYLATTQNAIKNGLCGLNEALTPEQIIVNWNGVDTLAVTVPDWPGGEDALRAAVEQVVTPYRKPAPQRVSVSIKQMLTTHRRVGMQASTRMRMV